MSKILIKSNGIIGEGMSGPGMRCWEFAQNLSSEHEVILAAPNKTNIAHPNFKIITYYNNDFLLLNFLRKVDVVITQNFRWPALPLIKPLKKPLVIDLYCPIIIENLENNKKTNWWRRLIHKGDLKFIKDQLIAGNFFICASEKQRDLWIGMLTAWGRVNPLTYSQDSSLRNLIDVVPFGLPNEKHLHTKQVIKGVYKNIKPDDKVLIWNGGLWDWLDPLTPIEAMAKIAPTHPQIKLLFMGISRPEDKGKVTQICRKAIQRAQELGLYNKSVFFYEGWVPYQERQNYLLEADIGIINHFDCLETTYAYRTRILDCIWANLPILTTRGDSLSELVEREKLGISVDYKNPDQLAKAILELVNNPSFYNTCKVNLKKIAPGMRWENIIGPLRKFCAHPQRAADKR